MTKIGFLAAAGFSPLTPFQHFAVLRFLPMVPRSWALRMCVTAEGTSHAVAPMSTWTMPIASPIAIAVSVRSATYVPTAITKSFMPYRT